MKKAKIFKRSLACLSAAATILSSSMVTNVNAAVITEGKPNNYDNFAEALQLALCFYDANKCGDEVADDGYYSWRGNCHVKDAEIPLQPMNPMPELYGEAKNDGSQNGKEQEKKEDEQPKGEGDGDGGLSAAKGLYEGVNMSSKFIEANRKYLDPDGDGKLDLTGGWHDAGDHVKFGLPGSFSASTVGWGYYEFRDAYKEMGLDKHVEDEMRWINDYFMKATFLDDDGNAIAYCYQVGEGNNDHNYWCAPELQVDDTVVASSSCAVKRPAYFATAEMPAPDQCAGAAASLAINYLNFKDTDADYAAKNLKYARALYELAVATHEESWTPGSTPSSLVLGYDGGFYHSSYDYDELSWAAVWLYYAAVAEDETQKDAAYDKYIKAIIDVDETTTNDKGAHPYTGYMKRIITDTGNCWQNIWVHCWDTVWGGVFAKLAPVTNTARDWYIFRYNLEFWSGCNAEVDASEWGYEPVRGHKYFGMDDYLWNTPMTCDQIPDLPNSDTSSDFIAKSPKGWAVVSGYGSARYNTAAGLCACVYAKTTGDDTFLPWAKAQMEYILGKNPMGYAYEVGYGNNFASQPHHRSSHCSGKQSMEDPTVQVHTLWGALVGGPDLKDFHNDVTKDYIYNEVTDDYNAGFCGDLAGLYHFYGAKGKELEKENHINPDFDMSANAIGYDQVDKDGNPLPVGIYAAGGKNQEQDSSVQLKVVIYNRTINPPKFESDLRARYYFNISELTEAGYDVDYIVPRIDYDQEKSYSNGKNEAKFTGPFKYDDDGNYYIDIQWKNCDFYGSRVFQFALTTKMDEDKCVYPHWDSTNDYSYADLVSFADDNEAAAITDKITLYADGELIWGVEPDGTKPKEEKKENTSADPSVTKKVLYGDTNCDGTVDLADAILIMQTLASPNKYTVTEQGRLNGDVDNTTVGLTSNDAMFIQEFLLKKRANLAPAAK
ncbi:MAG: glycoside hydrolase family 9 protein [Ruminococcus sp.]|uniref:glycoside hydrolase family 9 protein n=1 Tax=Ruminococcus sp. TaxID=41978 RepID=UPI0025EAFDB1|nr:glycoside hydrolase family 9 protein [Ruminococcus sp.]MBR6995922.1 glycoside hydrolase family 9 protein [Ruminococcus sp.]